MASLAFAVYKLSFFRGAWLLDLYCIGLNFSFPIIQKIVGCTIAFKEARARKVEITMQWRALNDQFSFSLELVLPLRCVPQRWLEMTRSSALGSGDRILIERVSGPSQYPVCRLESALPPHVHCNVCALHCTSSFSHHTYFPIP